MYYNAQISGSQLKFLDGNINNTQKLLDNLKLLQEQGLAKGSDVNKIDLQLQQLKTQKDVGQSNYTQILDALKFYMGIPLDYKIDVEENIDTKTKNTN